MKKSRFTDEQIIGFLKQAEGGMPAMDNALSGLQAGYDELVLGNDFTATACDRENSSML
ncbi:hypothetical protein N5J23_07335 [Comamonas aquatica]|uniref:Uncharacterized protein n=1 Tax=Comamonas aquatica TaxID=225991 RepID=A0AA42W338_9BURK|nr:hypothetical protein [Comamonas aquatica]MDH1429719.1 hypothetical protein [Comamonas aquatica]MDH1605319.1 hypothetical protein [Comamonas aquatica]MDH1616932.1 hypothetical protein [Comamonas aquatica]MDH2005354.1 hypothetical protein [Comamonas aquatica]